MALLTALVTSAAVTSLVTWNDSQPITAGDDVTRPFDVVATSTDGASNDTDTDYFWSPTMTSSTEENYLRLLSSSENYFRLPTTTPGAGAHFRSQRIAITRSIRLYGIVVAACLATVVAVALTAACVVVHGGSSSADRPWESSWFRRGSWCGRLIRRRSTAADMAAAATSGGGDGDYIYRPLGTGTGSALEDRSEPKPEVELDDLSASEPEVFWTIARYWTQKCIACDRKWFE